MRKVANRAALFAKSGHVARLVSLASLASFASLASLAPSLFWLFQAGSCGSRLFYIISAKIRPKTTVLACDVRCVTSDAAAVFHGGCAAAALYGGCVAVAAI